MSALDGYTQMHKAIIQEQPSKKIARKTMIGTVWFTLSNLMITNWQACIDISNSTLFQHGASHFFFIYIYIYIDIQPFVWKFIYHTAKSSFIDIVDCYQFIRPLVYSYKTFDRWYRQFVIDNIHSSSLLGHVNPSTKCNLRLFNS